MRFYNTKLKTYLKNWELLIFKVIVLFKNVWTAFVLERNPLVTAPVYIYMHLQYLLVRHIDLHFPYKKSFPLLSKALLLLFNFCSSLFLFSMCVLQNFHYGKWFYQQREVAFRVPLPFFGWLSWWWSSLCLLVRKRW